MAKTKQKNDTSALEVLESLSEETLLDWYRQMVLIRRIEEEAANGYQQGKIGGFLHLYIGEEATAVGSINALRDDDNIVVHYRDHAHAMVRGVEPRKIMAELHGKVTGTNRGKGGSMHMAQRDLHFWGGYAIVAGQLALATGISLGDEYRGDDRITICYFGDGASNNGYFHESLNLSKVWNLPVIWVCENNSYGMGTRVDRASAVTEMYQKACAYDIPAEQIGGQDVLDVYEATQNAAEHVRSGNGPYFLEFKTYRYRGHSMGDPERYREKEEVQEWRERDPINRFTEILVDNGVSEETLSEIEDKVEDVVQDAVQFANESDDPGTEVLYADVYQNPPEDDPFIYGR